MGDMVRVKICGITNPDDALAAAEAGADLLGFIFYARSPRYVTPETAAAIIAGLAGLRIAGAAAAPRTVGVFVNANQVDIQRIVQLARIDYVQLHGDEPPEFLAQVGDRAYKALRPASAELAQAEADRFVVRPERAGPRLLIDAYDPQAYGGTGQRADWQAAAAVARRHAGLLLAGGLTPDNVADAVRTVQPWGVDVSSGIEERPGRKDHRKLRALIEAARTS